MLSESIKEATKTAHQQLEVKVIKQLKAIRSNADYAEFLKHFYAYFNQVEKALVPFVNETVLPDYNERRNSRYLKNDIEALGGSLDKLPYAQSPAITNTVTALGALYVLEGSIMGGKVIVQMLAKGGITEGVSFFSGYGEATGAKWKLFTDVLNKYAVTEEDKELAIAAANETFSRFDDVFTAAVINN